MRGRKPASWVVVERATGVAVFETFNEATAAAINTPKYEAVPIGTWLASLNKREA